MSQRVCKSHKILVGLEIHVQLATKSKMFTGAANGFGGEPNSQVDPVILGLPGVLPVMNRKAVEFSVKVGLALGCTISKHTKWDRKSYYYPDLPKNYQISQYDLPCATRARLRFPVRTASPSPFAFGGRMSRKTPGSCCTRRRGAMRSTGASWTSTAPAPRCSKS